MRYGFRSRDWHIWVSIILALPLFIVGTSAVFIAHKQSLGTEEVRVDAKWLPGYRMAAASAANAEARAVLTTRSGETLIGAQDGLYRLEAGKPVRVGGFAAVPVRALAEAAFGCVLAAKSGIWLDAGEGWTRVLAGDGWSASVLPDGRVAVAVKEAGLLFSSDGRTWSSDPELSEALAVIAKRVEDKPLTLGKLVMDLHTGQALFGKAGEWIWIDALGIAMCLLAMTGVVMWRRGRVRRAASVLD